MQELSPRWIGEDPDNGECRSALAYRIEAGQIDGVDVSGLTFGVAAFIPGNVLKGGWRVSSVMSTIALRLSRSRSCSRHSAANSVARWLTSLGWSEKKSRSRRAPISFTVEKGRGTLRIGDGIAAEMEPYRGPTGEPTRLVESIFSTIPGSPAYVAKASRFRMEQAEIGVKLDLAGHNAIQGHFEMQG